MSSQRNLSHNVLPEISFQGQARTAAADGDNIIDMQGYEEALIVIQSGTITDGTLYTFKLEHGDAANLSDKADVPDADLISGGPVADDKEPAFAAADDDKVCWFGYKCTKRYIRITLAAVTGSPSTGGIFIGTVLKALARHLPVI
jgi:hypothetical protein